MAVVLIDGFDFYTTAEATARSWSSGWTMTAGRFDGQAGRHSSTVATKTRVLPSSYATLFAGFAFRASILPAGNADIFTLQAGATLAFRVGINVTGQIIIRNSGGTVVATGTTVLLASAWNYIEVKAFINGASGTCEVHLNGVVEIASTTGNFGSSNIDTVGCTQVVSNANTDFDDIYVLDSTGSAPRNTFLGDVRVETIYPTGAGAHTQWTPDSGANWARVSEPQADGDTSYVADGTPGDLDSYVFADIDGGATVYGIQVNLYARKDDAATRQIANLIRQASTDYIGSTVTLSSTYAFFSQLYNQDPTAADWTATSVNADEFGIKEIA
jgi:hypothetical protein